MKNNTILLLIILVVAAALRLYKLGTVPASMYIDEVAIGVDAKSIAQTGRDIHGNAWYQPIFPSYGDFKLPVYIWLASLTVKFFGATEFAVRLPSAIAGVISVYCVYHLICLLFSSHKRKEVIALSTAFLLAITPWSLLFSRTGFEGHVGQMMLLVSVLCAFTIQKRAWMSVVAGLMGGVATYSYFSVRFVFPVLFIAVFVLTFRKKTWRQSLFTLMLGLFVFFFTLIPMIRSPHYRPMEILRYSTKNIVSDTYPVIRSNELRDADNNTLFSRVIHHRYYYAGKTLMGHVGDHLNPAYLFVTGDKNLRHGTGVVGILYFSYIPFLVVGIYVCAKRYRKVGIFLLCWFIVALLPASVPYDTPHALRSLNGLIPLISLVGFGAYELFFWLYQKHLFVFIAVISGGLSLNAIFFIHDYFSHYPQRSAEAWSASRKAMAIYVRDHEKEYKNIRVLADERLFLWIVFYGNYDMRIIQRAEEKGYAKVAFEKVGFGFPIQNEFTVPNTLIIGQMADLNEFSKPTLISSEGNESLGYTDTRK
ncbi:MAG: glycosyltransferase family 39 protein [Candidatus Pacebacteria bacterium]|nr:glycosyltransferase family 39 protein [Candidatus Paceibacterota bacterium]